VDRQLADSTTFPALSDIGLGLAYGIYTAAAILSFFFVVRFVSETKGKELKEMRRLTVRPVAACSLRTAGSTARRSLGALLGPARLPRPRRSSSRLDKHAGAAWRPPDQGLKQRVPSCAQHVWGGRNLRRPEDW
jgi:hypothetical protein